MNNYIKALFSVGFAILSAPSFGNVQTVETDNYKEVTNIILQNDKRYSAEKTLLVFDIDNTLLTSGTRLGGDIWYQWQTGKLAIKPSAEEKVPCLYENAITMLYELSPMQLTEPQLPKLMAQWQQKHTTFALTSRAPDTEYATLRELNRNGINFSTSSLTVKGEKMPLDERGKLKRSWRYTNGVFFSSGQDKGQILDFLLNKTGQQYDAIIFVDDSISNIEAMKKMLASDKYAQVNSSIIHYTKVEADLIKKQGSVLNKQQVQNLTKEWQSLAKALTTIYPDRSILCPVK